MIDQSWLRLIMDKMIDHFHLFWSINFLTSTRWSIKTSFFKNIFCFPRPKKNIFLNKMFFSVLKLNNFFFYNDRMINHYSFWLWSIMIDSSDQWSIKNFNLIDITKVDGLLFATGYSWLLNANPWETPNKWKTVKKKSKLTNAAHP